MAFQVDQEMIPEDPPLVPPRPTEEEMNRTLKRRVQSQMHNQAASDEGLEQQESSSSPSEEKRGWPREEPPGTRLKKHNPFMPHVKARKQRNAREVPASITTEGTGSDRTLSNLLNMGQRAKQEEQDAGSVMEWWDTVEQWEELPPEDDMTDREEAKALVAMVQRVQKGVRVFDKLFLEWAEPLWQHVLELHAIADGLDRFHRNTKIAQVTGGSASALGGVATIAGLALAPVTMGVSLVVTAAGLAVATVGGLTAAGAGISDQVHHSLDRRRVERLLLDYQDKMADMGRCVAFIRRGMETLHRLDLRRGGRTPPVLLPLASILEDGAMAGKAVLLNASEILRVVQMTNMAAGSAAGRAVQLASMASGVLTGLFLGLDLYFLAKDSRELRRGAHSAFAARLRQVAGQLQGGLVELNGIRAELQAAGHMGRATANRSAAGEKDQERLEP